MTTVTTTVPDDAVGKIKRNAEIAFKSVSSYVVIGVSALAAVWLGLTDAQQAAFVAAHPILTPLAPYLAVVAWLAAKLAPQNIVLSSDKEAERKWLIARISELEATLGIVTTPLATDPVPPAPAAQVMGNLAAVTQPTDPRAAVQQLFPTMTLAQIRAALADPVPPVVTAAPAAPAQPSIVVVP